MSVGGHGTGGPTFHADLELLPDAGVGFFVAVKSVGTAHGSFGAAHFFQTSLFRQFMDRVSPGRPCPISQRPPPPGITLDWSHLVGSALAALAMLELVWLSLGFHLLSARLVY